MTQNEFVIEEADGKTILVRHLIAGVRYLFVIKGRTFSDLAGKGPKPSDLSCGIKLAHSLCGKPASKAGLIDTPVARGLPFYLVVNLKMFDNLSSFPVSYALAIERLRWRCAGAASPPCTPFARSTMGATSHQERESWSGRFDH